MTFFDVMTIQTVNSSHFATTKGPLPLGFLSINLYDAPLLPINDLLLSCFVVRIYLKNDMLKLITLWSVFPYNQFQLFHHLYKRIMWIKDTHPTYSLHFDQLWPFGYCRIPAHICFDIRHHDKSETNFNGWMLFRFKGYTQIFILTKFIYFLVHFSLEYFKVNLELAQFENIQPGTDKSPTFSL